MSRSLHFSSFFFFNDTATTEIYTLSLHDALPISPPRPPGGPPPRGPTPPPRGPTRSEEHTSELQSRLHLVCRLLLEKKKKNKNDTIQVDRYDMSIPSPQHTASTTYTRLIVHMSTT